jgi:tRNA dimethylallyltransferase
VAALVGATATGKTDAALEIAEAIDAEIVSCDSMQAYRGMDIGTAKPSRAQLARVPHHMIDVFEPSEDVTVAHYQAMSREAIGSVARRGRIPLLVGGSGLYFRAVVDALDFPPRAPTVRKRLEIEARHRGPGPMHERLAALDPRAAARIDARNVRRTVRALEVIEVTGRPFSEGYAWSPDSRYELCVAGLSRARADLFARIEARVDRMLSAGLILEARELERHGLGGTARQALGYRQVLDAAGSATIDDIRDAIVRATKKFARRQESWFRADPRIRWFDAATPGTTAKLVEHLGTAARSAAPPGEAGRASGVSLET